MKFSTRNLVVMALLVACSVLLRKVITIPLPVGVFSFGGFPIIFAGLFLGPSAGAIVGIVSDILGCIMFPTGPYLPYFTVTAALTGFIPAYTIHLLGLREKAPFWAILLSISLGQFVTKVLIIPVVLFFSFGVPYFFQMPAAFAMELFHVPVYAVFSHTLLKTQKDCYVKPIKMIIDERL